MAEPRRGILMVASFPDSILAFRGALIDAWLREGQPVAVAAPGLDDGSPVAAELRRRGVQVHPVTLQRTGRNPVADLHTGLQLLSLMCRLRPRFLLAYTAKPVVYGLLAGWLARVPHRFALITGLGYAFQPGRGATTGLVRRLYRAALSRAEKVLFQNRDDLALFLASGILDEDSPVAVVDGSGVDVSAYPPVPPQPGPTRFLMIARLLGDKGVREYAAAAAVLHAEYPDAVFALAGWLDEGNPDSIDRAELEGWTASGALAWLGRLDDVRPALAACSVYVLPSYREGMPRTVLEAMATGRPIITTDVPGCRETVVERENGVLVEARSASALAEAMRCFIEQPELAADMGRRSREIAERRFDVHLINQRMLQAMGIRSHECAEAGNGAR
jgi:glycosyltransferase involved in cell wall biosynthesis